MYLCHVQLQLYSCVVYTLRTQRKFTTLTFGFTLEMNGGFRNKVLCLFNLNIHPKLPPCAVFVALCITYLTSFFAAIIIAMATRGRTT